MKRPNTKIALIVFLGIGACLSSFFTSHVLLGNEQAKQLALFRFQQATSQIEHIQLLGKAFIQNASAERWTQIMENMGLVRTSLQEALEPEQAGAWGGEVVELERHLDSYEKILKRMFEPAMNLQEQKAALQQTGLTFSRQIEANIITPYRREEGLRTYDGQAIDPFKARIKDTAYDLNALHIKQQLILLELLLHSDLDRYHSEKQELAEDLTQHKARLRYMSVLIGDAPQLQPVITSLNDKLTDLVAREQAILQDFVALAHLDQQLSAASGQLLAVSRDLFGKIVADTLHSSRLTRTLNWSLLLGIVGILGTLGTLLARDIIAFVRDLKRAQTDLRESEDNLRVALYSIGDAVITTDTAGRVTRMNPTAEALTGWTFAEAEGEALGKIFCIVDGVTREPAPIPVAEAMAGDKIPNLARHRILVSRQGTEFQIAHSAAPIRHAEDAGTLGVILVFRDVTETYAQEQTIRENERLLQDITANIPGVVYLFEATRDHRYNHRFVSEKAGEIFGLDPSADNVFQEFLSHIPDDEKDAFLRSIADAVDRVGEWHYEGQFVKAAGETLWFSGTGVPHVEDDRVVFYGVLMDVTEKKQWETALATSEERYRQLFNEAPVMYVITEDRDGDPIVRDVNDMFLQVLGLSRTEALGSRLARYYTERSKKAMLDHGGYLRALRGSFTPEERSFITPSGEIIHTLLHALPEFDPTGQVVGTRAMFLDITARKHAEEEKKRLETALVQSQKMEAIGTLAGGIAHDFNNILSAVIGFTELALAEAEKDTDLHENLEQVYVAGMRATDLVRQILTLSRRTETELKPLQIAPLLKETLKLLRSSLPTTIEIVPKIALPVANVMADATQIHQIIMNLCTNAAHAMESDGGYLTVGLSQEDLAAADIHRYPGLDPRRYVKLVVQDSGAGIPPEIRKRIFDPYFTTKKEGKGTGLGLSVVLGIVQNYQGAVYVYSEPGQGTSFSVYIPAIEQSLAALGDHSDTLPTGTETILLVDDEPPLVALGRRVLESLGYRVTTATGSLEALELFRRTPDEIDLVISDMTMPKMTGDKLATRLLEIRADVPIILCSGFSDKLSEEHARDIGVKALVTKPIAKNVLATLVRTTLDSG